MLYDDRVSENFKISPPLTRFVLFCYYRIAFQIVW